MNITISFPWWWLCVASIVLGFVVGVWRFSKATDWDVLNPLLGAGSLILGIAFAVALAIGKLWL